MTKKTILITTGTTSFPFLRMDNLVNHLYKNNPGYQFYYQNPLSELTSLDNLLVKKEIPFDKLISLIKKSYLIISHGGPGTIHLIKKYHKNKPIIIPRIRKYGEHVNNHQIEFNKNCSGIFLLTEIKTDLIENYIKKPIKQKKLIVNNNKSVIRKFEKYINQIMNS